MIKISKELLSEVLENEVVKFKIVSTKRITQVRIWYKDTELHLYESWDIYHLAHKCKEWAFKYRYMIDSNISPTFKEVNNGIVGTSLIYNLNNMESKRFQSDTEPDAIFKACEYILKEIK